MMNEKIKHHSWLVNQFVQLIRAIRMSIHQLSASLSTTIITFLIIGITLALPMGLYVLLKNVQQISLGLNHTSQISLYLNMDVSQNSIHELQTILKNDQSIESSKYISPEEGLKSFQNAAGFNNLLSDLKKNPLPGVIVIQPAKSIQTLDEANQLMTRLKTLPNVKNVQLDMAWLQRLNAIVEFVHRILNAVMILFAFAVLLIVFNTIRSATQNHRDEIAVVKFLGGTNRFIYRPFLYSGLIYGLIGSIIAWFLIDTIILWLQAPVTTLVKLYDSPFQLQGLNLHTTLLLLLGGALLGYIGSWYAVKQHIQGTT